METLVKKPDEQSLELASNIIKTGGLVAFKTETVYGLGADAYNVEAVKNIFAVKGRPADNPLIVHLSDVSQILNVAKRITPLAQKLIDAFLPGALTLILDRADSIPAVISAGLDTIAVRIPSDKTANAFLKAAGVPIAAPSANTSTRPSPTTAMDVYEDLKGKIPLILDGGDCTIGLESTVIDARGEKPVILRYGGVTQEQIEKVLGFKLSANTTDSKKPIAPGMKYRHYAPNAEMYYVSYGKAEMVEKLYNDCQPKKTVVIAINNTLPAPKSYQNFCSLGIDAKDAAHNLFRLLRELEKEYEVIIAYACPEEGLGVSVNSRMKKAAGKNII
ncbi:MAG TPA: L-threonylcarbamoyladenylate synthase [Clostridia bacterium]